MEPATNHSVVLHRVLVGAVIICVLWYGLSIFSTIQARTTTGILAVNPYDPHVVVSVSQPGHQAAIIGTGNTRVRLFPGTYLVAGSINGSKSSTVVTVHKQQLAKVALQEGEDLSLPTTQNITFTGIDGLLTHGFSTAEVNNMKELFFTFKTSAKQIDIDDSTLQSGPIDQATATFTMNFAVNIDGKNYDAHVSYGVGDEIRLVLHDTKTSVVVFSDSSGTDS